MEDFKKHNEILQIIKNNGLLGLSKDNMGDSLFASAIRRLKAEGLITGDNVVSLTKDGYEAQLRGFENWKEKQSSQHQISPKQLNNYGSISFGEKSNILFFSDNSSIDVKTDEEVLSSLNNAIELLRQNQNIDAIVKAKFIDMYENLQSTITQAKDENLPIMDNLLSIASSLFGIILAVQG